MEWKFQGVGVYSGKTIRGGQGGGGREVFWNHTISIKGGYLIGIVLVQKIIYTTAKRLSGKKFFFFFFLGGGGGGGLKRIHQASTSGSGRGGKLPYVTYIQ